MNDRSNIGGGVIINCINHIAYITRPTSCTAYFIYKSTFIVLLVYAVFAINLLCL